MSEPLTVCTWLWRQPGCRTRYTAEHVNTWARMVSRNLSMPHRLVCFTDMPDGIDASVDARPLPRDLATVHNPNWQASTGKPQCYRRLAMFRRDAADWIGPRFVSMDLDCVIFDALDPLFERDEDLVLFRGTGPRRPYNGSLVLMTAGARPQVFDDFTPEQAAAAGRRHLGSDQGWLAYKLGPDEAKFTNQHGAHHMTPSLRRRLQQRGHPPSGVRVVFFPGRVKPWDMHETGAIRRFYQ